MTEPLRIPDLTRPRLPWPMRALNVVGAPFARSLVQLEPNELLETAARQTGLTEFGADGFREPLAVLTRAVQNEAQLSALGRYGTREFFLQLLRSRLRLEDLIRRHPEILEEEVARPILIVGLPRTGTTHLHNLIAQDPALRSLTYWESLEPFPDPALQLGADGVDPRIRRCERALGIQNWAMPLFKRMHEMTAYGYHEEIQLLAIDFSTMLFESSYYIPSYAEWYKGRDQTEAYRYLKRILQALQWLRGPRRWVLKSPQHLEQIRPLLEVFPDARFVQTHRDPLRITASLCTMVAYSSRMQSAALDVREIGRYWAARTEDLLRASVAGRSLLPEAQTFDVVFREFMQDDLATVAKVYDFADQPLTPQAQDAQRAFMAANPRGKHGTIAYILEDLGVDPAERRQALHFYQERFGIPDE